MFQKLGSSVRQKYNSFFGQKLPGLMKKGGNFFNQKVVPYARLAHNVVSAAAGEISKSDMVGKDIRSAAENVNRFAGIGLRKITDAQTQISKDPRFGVAMAG